MLVLHWLCTNKLVVGGIGWCWNSLTCQMTASAGSSVAQKWDMWKKEIKRRQKAPIGSFIIIESFSWQKSVRQHFCIVASLVKASALCWSWICQVYMVSGLHRDESNYIWLHSSQWWYTVNTFIWQWMHDLSARAQIANFPEKTGLSCNQSAPSVPLQLKQPFW